MAAFLGHLYPVYFGFRGGKGVATAFGLLVVLSRVGGARGRSGIRDAVLVTRYISLGSVLAAAVAAVARPCSWAGRPTAIAIILMAVLIVVRHLPNLKRLLAGQESKVGKVRRR